MIERRRFLQLAALTTAQLLAFGRPARAAGMGELTRTPDGRFDLPPGFRAVLVQKAGAVMTDGYRAPGRFDGMTCHVDRRGNYVLLRNHEIGDGAWLARDAGGAIPPERLNTYTADPHVIDPTRHGGVSKVTVDAPSLLAALGGTGTVTIRDSRMLLVGTDVNCSGGRVPEGWVSCEESHAPGHGWAWLVPARAKRTGHHTRLDAWGRFRHEAIAIGPDRAVYQTEDDKKGLLYRFTPDDPANLYGAGRLEALCLPGLAAAHEDGKEVVHEGQEWTPTWVTIADPAATTTKCLDQGAALGATRFCRNEGVTADATHVWFVSSLGGPAGAGQVWRYTPSTGTLRLMRQATSRGALSMPDNLVTAPWGDVVLAEDNYDSRGGVTANHLRGLTPAGEVYDIARNAAVPAHGEDDSPGDEFAGPCFSPDGRVLFVNLQGEADETWAITGPWPTG